MMHLNFTNPFVTKPETNGHNSSERLIRQWLMDGKNQQGIQIDKEDEVYKWTPIHWAAYFGKMDCLRAITLHKPIVDQPSSNFGQTPLHVAAFTGQTLCVEWLINTGGNVNKQDVLLETPLHKAARTGNVECLDILIKNGAELRIPNKDGLTPEIICYLCGHMQCYDYLTRIGPLNLSNGFHERKCEMYNAEWIRQGLNGGHLPDVCESFANGGFVSRDVNLEMDIDDTSMFKRGGIDYVKNGCVNLISGRKRSYGDDVNCNIIKRMKSNEEADLASPLVENVNCATCQDVATSASVGDAIAPYVRDHQSVYGIYDINRHLPRYSSNGFEMEQGTVQFQKQASVHVGNMYSLYAYSTLIADMHGS